jgi:hypothetical protein
MAVLKVLVDDFDDTHSTAETPVRTRRFTIDGDQYEIDLTDSNHQQLRADLARWAARGRCISRAKAPTGKKSYAPIDKIQKERMRKWLEQKGVEVSKFGRLPQSAVDLYNAEHQPPSNGNGAVPNPAFSAAS